MNNPTQHQVGGDHYTKLAIQPMQYSMANGLNALQHTIVNYVTRYKDKGGIEDLRKAARCVELLIQYEMDEAHKRDGWTPEATAGAAFKQPYHDAVLHGHEQCSETDQERAAALAAAWEEGEKRIEQIGPNGNDGAHYWQINRGVAPPLPSGTRVMVELRDGDRATGEVQTGDWSLDTRPRDIIRWRLA